MSNLHAVCNRQNSRPTVSTEKIVDTVIELAQKMATVDEQDYKVFYPYQVVFGKRIVESLLLRDGQQLTGLFSRQVGKTEIVADTVAAIGVIFPELAKAFPDDWRFNLTDDDGRYRGFKNGVKIGIYAPIRPKARIAFDRMLTAFSTQNADEILESLDLGIRSTASVISITNGTRILCETASPEANIEGETHHIVICDECQAITSRVLTKSISPMVSSFKGTIVKIGTPDVKKNNFYDTIEYNKKLFATKGLRNNFFFPYTICQKYNSLYAEYVLEEKERIGENSDEFQMAFACKWLLERGMFITTSSLMDPSIAITHGDVGNIYDHCGLYQPVNFFGKITKMAAVAGIDFGRDNDSTVVTVMLVDWENPLADYYQDTVEEAVNVRLFRKHIIGWLKIEGDDYESQFWRIKDYLDGFRNLAKITVDKTGCGSPIFDRMRAVYEDVEVEGLAFTTQFKSDGYKTLYSDIVGKRVTFPFSEKARKTRECREFIQEMLDLQKEYRSGYLSVSHPDKPFAHDDYSDSAMLACWGAQFPSTDALPEVIDGNLFFN